MKYLLTQKVCRFVFKIIFWMDAGLFNCLQTLFFRTPNIWNLWTFLQNDLAVLFDLKSNVPRISYLVNYILHTHKMNIQKMIIHWCIDVISFNCSVVLSLCKLLWACCEYKFVVFNTISCANIQIFNKSCSCIKFLFQRHTDKLLSVRGTKSEGTPLPTNN